MSNVFLRSVRAALVAQWREKQALTNIEGVSSWNNSRGNRFFSFFSLLSHSVE